MSSAKTHCHPYYNCTAALATKHAKERQIVRPLYAATGLRVIVPPNLDTDQLGTFTGEIAREGSPREVAERKARLGMTISGLSRGLASEGSFGMHPLVPFLPSDHEILLFIDDELGIQVLEQITSEKTNFAHISTSRLATPVVQTFLQRAQFPSHGLIARPSGGERYAHAIIKGITDLTTLENAIRSCAALAPDGLAVIETDMRAHMNPTRQRVLRHLAFQLARRLTCLCPHCQTPGWGRVDVIRGLPCEWCGSETEMIRAEISGCPRCSYREQHERIDGLRYAPQERCPSCNP